MSHDSSPPVEASMDAREIAAHALDAARSSFAHVAAPPRRGFVIEIAESGARMRCGDVHGFDEAEAAACDPRAPTPTRLALVAPDEAAAAWLARWAEDTEQVRRRLTLRRGEGGAEITLVATIASFGHGVATSLAVESVRAFAGVDFMRSGVHPKADVEAALARYDARHRPE